MIPVSVVVLYYNLIDKKEKYMAVKKQQQVRKKKIVSFLDTMNYLHLLRFLFFIFLALFIVYIYYLHTKRTLLSTEIKLWKMHSKIIMEIAGAAAYTLVVFYLGYQKGKKV